MQTRLKTMMIVLVLCGLVLLAAPAFAQEDAAEATPTPTTEQAPAAEQTPTGLGTLVLFIGAGAVFVVGWREISRVYFSDLLSDGG